MAPLPDNSVLATLRDAVHDGSIQCFIDGAFVFDSTDCVIATVDPSTERRLIEVQIASPLLVDCAVKSARRAFDVGPWPRMRPAERASYLFEIADLIEAQLSDIALLETRDTGLPIVFTLGGHIPKAVSQFRYFAEEGLRIIGDVYSLDSAYMSMVMREPIGVAAIITPWNAPLAVAASNVAAALAAGNCCVLKPSEQAPLTAAMLANIVAQSNLPPGVLNIVFGPGHTTGEALTSHSGVDVISFTGGVIAGERIMSAACRGFKRLGLEMGGRSVSVIFDDADLGAALDGTVLSVFANNGEFCAAGARILVSQGCYDSFVSGLAARAGNICVDYPTGHATEVGPLISAEHRQGIIDHIESALEEGAHLICGGRRPPHLPVGYFLSPAVLAEVNNSMHIAQIEVFGPVATVIPFDGAEDTAVKLANDSRFGLAGYVWTNDSQKALRVAQGIRSGFVAINSPFVRDARTPFGGYKSSGIGRTGGRHSIDLFTELKTTCVPIRPYALPRLGMLHNEV